MLFIFFFIFILIFNNYLFSSVLQCAFLHFLPFSKFFPQLFYNYLCLRFFSVIFIFLHFFTLIIFIILPFFSQDLRLIFFFFKKTKNTYKILSCICRRMRAFFLLTSVNQLLIINSSCSLLLPASITLLSSFSKTAACLSICFCSLSNASNSLCI